MDKNALLSMYLDEEDSDISFRFENEEPGCSLSIPVHSFILKRISDVFKTMLEKDNFKESHTNVIEIEIMGDVNVGLHFVKYLYTKTLVDLEPDLYTILMKMAHMYNIYSLLQECESRIQSRLDTVSVCRLYQALEAISSPEFREHCIKYMLKFAFLIFMDCRQVCLHESTMKILLESNYLNVVNENQVLEAVWYWARVRCIQENRPGNINAQSAAANLLCHIRWDLLKNDVINFPWCKLLEEHKVKSSKTGERDGFVPSFSVNTVAKRLKLSNCYGNSMMEFRRENKYLMLMFSVNKDILISGISFVVCLKNCYSWKNYLIISLNNTEINSCVTSREILKNFYVLEHQKQKNVYSYRVDIELVKPRFIRQACINTITMQVCSNCEGVAFQQYLWKNSPSNPCKSEQDVQFSIQGKLSSITSLYYFLKK